MSERSGSRREKTRAQDLVGFLFCGVGGFFAVSLSLSLFGWESQGGPWTWPVEELLLLLGPWAALFLALGVAVLGSALFLRDRALAPGRPLAGLAGATLGLALFLGAPGGAHGGEVGAAFPGVLGGLAGAVSAVVLGAALLWVSAWVGFGSALAGMKTARQHGIGSAARLDASDGVSAAEAALLVTEAPRKSRPAPAAAPAARPLPAPARTPKSTAPEPPPVLRDETIRPYTPPTPPAAPAAGGSPAPAEVAAHKHAGADLAKEKRTSVADRERRDERRAVESAGRAPGRERAELGTEVEAKAPPPTWEVESDEATSEPEVSLATDTDAPWTEGGSTSADEAGSRATPAWEQVSLFDAPPDPALDDEVLEDVATTADEVTDERAVELEDADEDELVVAREAQADDAEDGELEPHSEPAAPHGKPKTRPSDARWEKLVYEAGCLVLEQNRVAVSMIERRFELDFDRACEVLDELQEAGLIGPYMGGRTRDILLTREEWLAHDPRVS
jgi:hypothetical protein